MFNILLSIHHLFVLSLMSFFCILTIRQLLIRRLFFVCIFHMILFVCFFVATIGGGGVQNDGYKRLEEFIQLEHNNQLEFAKTHPEHYDRMLQIDLQQFKNSMEFKEYLHMHDKAVDNAEALCIGWLFVLLAELSMALVFLLRKIK